MASVGNHAKIMAKNVTMAALTNAEDVAVRVVTHGRVHAMCMRGFVL